MAVLGTSVVSSEKSKTEIYKSKQISKIMLKYVHKKKELNKNKSCRLTARSTASGLCQALGQIRLVTQSMKLTHLLPMIL